MRAFLISAAMSLSLFSLSIHAETTHFEITIKDHRFTPDTLTVPANQKIKLKIINNDASPEEFESHSLNREKVIHGNSSAVIFIGPLQSGEYEFVGEFNEETAKGKIIAVK
jgi:hypothetical protein